MNQGKPLKAPVSLIINGTAIVRSSLGARRYYDGVMRHLNWPGRVELTRPARWSRLERASELLERGRANSVYWSPCHRGPLFAAHHVVTVLDCINIEHVYRDDWRLPLLRGLLRVIFSNASAVVAISEATRAALLRNFVLEPSKLVVIAGPVDLRDASINLAKSGMQLARAETDYVLMIANALPHKNTANAGRAFAASSAARRGVSLRIVGSMEASGLAACHAAGVRVEQYQGIDDATLQRWLAGCMFLFSPSLEEGLNLPVAEALSCGANVLCSDIAVHREFYHGMALLCDPLHRLAMTEALDDALSRGRHWGLPNPQRPQRSFSDVANDYRVLFKCVADGRTPLLPH